MSPREIHTRVVGVTFEGRQSVIAQLRVGERVRLCREPANLYDRHAIRVVCLNGQQIGYLSRSLAATLAERFDVHGKPVPAVVTALPGGYSPNAARGVRIRFTPPRRLFVANQDPHIVYDGGVRCSLLYRWCAKATTLARRHRKQKT